VKFLNFREALERLEKYALAGHALRAAMGATMECACSMWMRMDTWT
jgi:hypothetical protein